ncbi:hypothetical protein F4811DRAFT_567501 [Daldinia bambusicola]|nr:hypothetical protein F4811DRAFT_567501 [Daldinia bambusicola]
MAPRLTLDVMAEIAKRMPVWDCLRMGLMNRELNQMVFNWTIRYIFEHPNRFNSLEPIDYALASGNVRLLRTLRDLILTDTVVIDAERGTKMRWDTCMEKLIHYHSMVQILVNPGGRECFELILDTAIQTGTVPSLNIWSESHAMLLGNAICQGKYLAMEIILSRRQHLGIDNFMEEMCFRNIPVIDGWLFKHHLPRTTVEVLIRVIGFSFYDACRLDFPRAIQYFLENDHELTQYPERILEGYAHLIECPSWFSNPWLPGKPICRTLLTLQSFYKKTTGNPVPTTVVNRLLNQMWRVILPYVRRDGSFGERTDITQEQLLDVTYASHSCRAFSRHFNIIINMDAYYSTIPRRDPNETGRLGNIRFVDLVRRENIVLPLVFQWTQSDLTIIYTP